MAESHCTTWEVTGFGRRECGSSIVQMGDESSSDGMEGWRSSGVGKSGVNSGLATSYWEKHRAGNWWAALATRWRHWPMWGAEGAVGRRKSETAVGRNPVF